MADKRVDQQAIAEKLGISRSTVTRVLNHDPLHRISPATREQIFRTAAELGYQARRRRTGNIALVVCGEMASAQQELHLAICEEALKSDYRVFLVRMPEMPSYSHISLHVNPQTSDGAVLTGRFSDELAGQVSDILPLVLVGNNRAANDVDTIVFDDVQLGRMLTSELISAGHRRVAMIVQFPQDIRWAGAAEGYRLAHEEAGLRADLSLVASKSGRFYPELLAAILSSDPKPTGLLAITSSDHALILTTLMAMGCIVPRDLSYVGWAYSYTSALLPFLRITCLDDLYGAMARSAVRRLLDRAENRALPAERIEVSVGVNPGETCVPVSK